MSCKGPSAMIVSNIVSPCRKHYISDSFHPVELQRLSKQLHCENCSAPRMPPHQSLMIGLPFLLPLEVLLFPHCYNGCKLLWRDLQDPADNIIDCNRFVL